MSFTTNETIQRLFSQFARDLLGDLPPEQRALFQEKLQERADELLRGASPDGPAMADFNDIVGLGPGATRGFETLRTPTLSNDFDEAVIPSQLHAAADLYYIYQHERMQVFRVVEVLLRLFHEGRMRIQRGPGARALYLIEKHRPMRYTQSHRLLAYRRAFNYGNLTPPSDAIVYRNFHHQFLAFASAIAQYFRDLLIGEVIRGSQLINQRPFGSQATIQRVGEDLRFQLDRASYGFILPLTLETGNYLETILEALDTADIKRSFDANTKWDVVEIVSNRYLGGAREISQRTKMADAGRRLLNYVADNPFRTRDFNAFQAEIGPLGPVAEEWIAAYRMTPEGRRFPGVTEAMQQTLGLPNATRAA